MFETLTRLYDGGNGKLTAEMLSKAVIMNWITEEEKQTILATKN